MARIRLNKNKREDLLALAALKLRNTTLPDGIQTALTDARKEYLDVYPEYVRTLKMLLKEMHPLKKLKIHNEAGNLIPIRELTIQRGADFIGMPFPHMENTETMNMLDLYLSCAHGIHTYQLGKTFKAQGKDLQDMRTALAKGNIWYCVRTAGYSVDFKTLEYTKECTVRDSKRYQYLDKTGKVYALCRRMEHAIQKLQGSEAQAYAYTAKLRQSYAALIQGSNTLEDVAKIWPEADELRDTFLADAHLPCTLSAEALELIQTDVRERTES